MTYSSYKILHKDTSKSSTKLQQYWKGGLWKILASVCFAAINGMVRYLSGGVPSLGVEPLPYYEIAFLQNIVGTLVLLPWFLNKGVSSLKITMPGFYALYILCAVAGLILWYGALHYMPLTQAVALAFTGPIFTLIGCRVFLKEELTLSRILAIIISFVGAFVITRPDQALIKGEGLIAELGLYALFPLLSAIAWVGSKLAGRVLASRGESISLMTIYLFIFMAPVSFIPAFVGWVTPSAYQLMWITGIGLTSCLAHLTLMHSYALADVSFLMPFGFTRLLLSGVIGYFAFGEIPQSVGMWVGMLIIIISLGLLAYDKSSSKNSSKEKFSKDRTNPAPRKHRVG